MKQAEPRRLAVLVGSSRYDDAGIRDYETITNSVDKLKELFDSSALWQECTAVRDPKSVFDVMLPIRKASEACRQGDTLLVYYVGHAINPPRAQHGDILLALRTTIDREHWSYLPLFHVYDMIRRSRASAKVLILDCCYCGAAEALGPDSADASRDPQWLLDEGSTCVIKATARASIVQEVDSYMEKDSASLYTAFSGYLISVLDRGVDGARDPLQVRDVYNELRRILPASGRHAEPELLIRNEPQIVLMENRSPRATHGHGDPSQLARLRAAPLEELCDAWAGRESVLADVPPSVVDEFIAEFVPGTDDETLSRLVHCLHKLQAGTRLDELLALIRVRDPERVGSVIRELWRQECDRCRHNGSVLYGGMVGELQGMALHRFVTAVNGD